jgi:hypothetical protein
VNQFGVPHNPESGNPDGFIGKFTLSDAGFAFANSTQTLVTDFGMRQSELQSFD